jgi:hypothetical protein
MVPAISSSPLEKSSTALGYYSGLNLAALALSLLMPPGDITSGVPLELGIIS